MERQPGVHRGERLRAAAERVLRQRHSEERCGGPVSEFAGAREGGERLLVASEPPVHGSEPERRGDLRLEPQRPRVRLRRLPPALETRVGGAEVGGVARLVRGQVVRLPEGLERRRQAPRLGLDRADQVPRRVGAWIAPDRLAERRQQAGPAIGRRLEGVQPLGDEGARRVGGERAPVRRERLLPATVRLEELPRDGVVEARLLHRARRVVARGGARRRGPTRAPRAQAHEPQDRLRIEVGMRRERRADRRAGLVGAPEAQPGLRQHLVRLREPLPGVRLLQLLDRPPVVAPLQEVGGEVAVVEDLRVGGSARGSRCARLRRAGSGHVRRPLVAADVPERSEARQQLRLRLAGRRIRRGGFALARRADRLVRRDAALCVRRQEGRIERGADDASRHLVGRRQAEEFQDGRRDVEEARRLRQTRAAPRAGAAEDEDPLLVVPLDRLLGRVGEHPLRAPGPRSEAVVGEDEHRRPRAGRVDHLAEQTVLVRVEPGDRVLIAREIGLGADRHARGHAVLEAVPHHVDPLEIDTGEIGVARGEIGRDARVVGAAGQDRQRQRRRVLHRPTRGRHRVTGLLQHLAARPRQGGRVEVQDRPEVRLGEIGSGLEQVPLLDEIVGRPDDPRWPGASLRPRAQRLEGQQVGDLEAPHRLRRVRGPPGDEGARHPGVVEDVPEGLDLAEAAGDRDAPSARLLDGLEIGDAVHVGADAGDDCRPQKRRDHRVVRAQTGAHPLRDEALQPRHPSGPHQGIDGVPVGPVEADEQHPDPGRIPLRHRPPRPGGRRSGRGRGRADRTARGRNDEAVLGEIPSDAFEHLLRQRHAACLGGERRTLRPGGSRRQRFGDEAGGDRGETRSALFVVRREASGVDAVVEREARDERRPLRRRDLRLDPLEAPRGRNDLRPRQGAFEVPARGQRPPRDEPDVPVRNAQERRIQDDEEEEQDTGGECARARLGTHVREYKSPTRAHLLHGADPAAATQWRWWVRRWL